MSQVSRPVQVLLLVTVLFCIVWFVALRPKGASGGLGTTPAARQSDAPGAKGLARAVAKAHGAVTTADAAAQRSAGGAVAPSATAKAGAPAQRAVHAHAKHVARHVARTHAVHLSRADVAKLALVRRALRQHKAIAIAFVDPAISDARAVAVEVAHVSHFGGRAVVLSAPIAQLSRYDVITHDVQVTVAPTTVIVARNGQATTIVGYADRGEIQQRLADALVVKP
jgi:hypothetical protein